MERSHALGWLLATALPWVTPTAFAARPAACSTLQRPAQALPDPVVCTRAVLRSSAGTQRDTATQVGSLFEIASAAADAGRPQRASEALDCADAVIAAAHPAGDWPLRYQAVRRRSLLAYREERIDVALDGFECALHMATQQGDRTAIAKDLKNVGSALRRLGDFPGALRASTRSLDMLRADGGDTGAVSNNIADIYRDLGESEEAEHHYRDAASALRKAGNVVEAAHVLESMAMLALDNGDPAQAQAWLQQALADYRSAGQLPYQVRVHAWLTRMALSRGEMPAAAEFSATGLALAEAHHLTVPAALQLQAARVDRLRGRPQAAKARLAAALAELPEADADRVLLLEELGVAQEADADAVGALATFRRAREAERTLAKARYDRQLGWLRSRFETAERDRTIAALEHQNQQRAATLRQRTLLLWALAVSALAAVLGLWLLLQRRQHRHRLAAAAQESRHEEALAHYRREAEALAEDRSLLQTLLDSREDAVCLLDTEGQVLAANRAACGLLTVAPGALVGAGLPSLLGATDGDALALALERMEDSSRQTITLQAGESRPALRGELGQWEHGDGLVLLQLGQSSTVVPPVEDGGTRRVAISAAGDARTEFRHALVDLMLTTIDTWERGSGQNRIELAERSKLWRVYIDDGRLRTRAMERYLNVARLPQNPRWRDVVRTAYFVLGECRLDVSVRDALQHRVDAVLSFTRRSPLV